MNKHIIQTSLSLSLANNTLSNYHFFSLSFLYLRLVLQIIKCKSFFLRKTLLLATIAIPFLVKTGGVFRIFLKFF